MSKAVTRAALVAAVESAVRALPTNAAPERVAERVAHDPRILPGITPVSRLESQTLRGIAIAAGAPLLMALGRLFEIEIAEGDAALAISTLASLAGAAYAWYGRETTTRPLK